MRSVEGLYWDCGQIVKRLCRDCVEMVRLWRDWADAKIVVREKWRLKNPRFPLASLAAIYPQSLHHPFTLAPQSLHNLSTISSQSPHNLFIISSPYLHFLYMFLSDLLLWSFLSCFSIASPIIAYLSASACPGLATEMQSNLSMMVKRAFTVVFVICVGHEYMYVCVYVCMCV